ncbi:bifunctional folylpolyglutamate synthase/dihydrofolate synthase [Roseofilum casamattae]|uniref:tetrahydrofolate synthase n=1 Tax=Roseofilum casamattae BLCC-M143 TaxID=3022442 RepID=A0ABT7BTN8_9CYAN|nr:bifunctional folylpolyglutamate synthase/dihydrofolate synthase [Roseofilum casamattae BLCC-M143]
MSLGLDRIKALLAALGNPHHRIPMVHVAGTNGKGSVCAYLSSIFATAGYRVGRYTSPHLIDWTERICINGEPIAMETLHQVLVQVLDAAGTVEAPTSFELLVAAAWLYFAQSGCDLAVMEVGLGGRLDATNVCDRPLAAIIVSIGWDHAQILGPTLADIAREKAGILKPGCPAIIGPVPPEAKQAIDTCVARVNCLPIEPEPAIDLGNGRAQYGNIQYSLPLEGKHQLSNSALAIAAMQVLDPQKWQISADAIAEGIARTRWRGRLQWSYWQDYPLLVDGAHNPESAIALRDYLDSSDRIQSKDASITWVMGMLTKKSHHDIFQTLLRPGDTLYLVPVPNHRTASPEELAELAQTLQPQLKSCETYPDLGKALDAAVLSSPPTIVLCGSLYLVGYYFSLFRDW